MPKHHQCRSCRRYRDEHEFPCEEPVCVANPMAARTTTPCAKACRWWFDKDEPEESPQVKAGLGAGEWIG